MLRWITLIVLAAGAGPALAQTVQLISAEEAKLPAATPQPPSRAITRGPGVRLASPDTVSGEFPFKVAFEPRGGSRIDPSSVKVEYLKGAGIDLTERLKPAIRSEGIELGSASAPVGDHPIRVSVRDTEGRSGSSEFRLKVK